MNTNFIFNIQKAIREGKFVVSFHAYEEAEDDQLQFHEVYESVFAGEIIEEYPPGNRPFPSCLIFGKTKSGEPVHSVWAYDSNKEKAIAITVYRPDPEKWIEFRLRKKE